MNLKKFLGKALVMLAFMLSAFWVMITGVYILPFITERLVNPLTPFFYALGTIALAVIILCSGFKYLKVFGDDEND